MAYILPTFLGDIKYFKVLMILLSLQFYFYFEFGIFLFTSVLVGFSIKRLFTWRMKLQRIIFFFLLFYFFSIGFSATLKLFHVLNFQNNPFIVNLNQSSYLYQMFVAARWKYFCMILSNLMFGETFYEIYSKPKRQYSKIAMNFTFIVLTLYFIPIFNTNYKFFLRILLLLHIIIMIYPIMRNSIRMRKQTEGFTREIMNSTLLLSSLLSLLLLIVIFDAVFTSIFKIEYSVFYFLGWVVAMLALFTATYKFLYCDWTKIHGKTISYEKIQEIQDPSDLNQDQVSRIIFIKCPHCQSAKYYTIPYKTYLLVEENVSGITSMLIPKKIVCEHTFIIYIDKSLKVRSIQKLDVVVKKVKKI